MTSTMAVLILCVLHLAGANRQIQLPPGEPETAPPVESQNETKSVEESNGALRHTKLGSYLASELAELKAKDEMLLLLLMRDLKRLVRLQKLSEKRFYKLFPTDFSQKGISLAIGKSILASTFSLAGAANLDAVVKLAVGYGGKALGFGGMAKYLLEYSQSLQESNKRIVKLGGKATTAYWRDVKMGTIWESFYKIRSAHRMYKNVAPTLVKTTPLRNTKQCAPKVQRLDHLKKLGVPVVKTVRAGTLVKTTHRQDMGEPCNQVQFFDVQSQETISGWVPRDSFAFQGWYISSGTGLFSKGILVQSRPSCDAHPDGHVQSPWILTGESFTVIDKDLFINGTEIWKLGDGRGWICATPQVQAIVEGPLSRQEANLIRNVLLVTLNPAAKGDAKDKALANIHEVVSSPRGTVTRFLTKLGLGVGAGLVSGGALLLPALVVSVGDSVGSAAVSIASTASLAQKTTFVIASLVEYEKEIFEDKLISSVCETCETQFRRACDVREEMACSTGELCLRGGLFSHVDGETEFSGVCVKAPLLLLPIGATCLTDMDCQSSYCHFKSKDGQATNPSAKDLDAALIEDMIGKCRQVEAPRT